MKEASIEILNRAVADKLSAINQYMYFFSVCDEKGYNVLASLFKNTAMDEMMHTEKLADRIRFLKGKTTIVASREVIKVDNIREMLNIARKMEQESTNEYNNMVIECFQNDDTVSRKLFESLIVDEEKHFSQYDKEIDNINRYGTKCMVC